MAERSLDRKQIQSELDRCVAVLEKNMKRFGTDFPSACATDGRYRIKKNDDWTNGFWTGMLWMAYEYTGRDAFKELALQNVASFEQRLEEHFVLDHHDIGFLYSLSVAAAWKITGDESIRPLVIRAADVLMARFQERGGFIQAWGKAGDPKEFRLIIDSLLNLPLLYTAFEMTGEARYREVAETHYQNVIHHIVRDDFSTYHTFYFDAETGKPDHGATHQGFSDQSCWARGQAWAILGMPLHRRLSGMEFTEEEQTLYSGVLEYFESHLPKDGMPYWDLIFTDGSDQPRDSSALAVAACGMLEMGNTARAEEMVLTLKEGASSEVEPESEGILLHGVYAYAEGKGVDEPNLWGDYFYMEALYRLWNPDWNPYW
ncbi:MAG: glycoside hydrolase family 88 protein [Eubacteriales bacterium]|nr:glycoside hydrolase family 88 protein [Eubacteriales bacterium]